MLYFVPFPGLFVCFSSFLFLFLPQKCDVGNINCLKFYLTDFIKLVAVNSNSFPFIKCTVLSKIFSMSFLDFMKLLQGAKNT